nr:dihydroorotase [Saprospiraceae bacterium]
MYDLIVKNAKIVNRGRTFVSDLAVKEGRIVEVASSIQRQGKEEIDAVGMLLMPGIIDDQVHFREPGLTHKANIQSESSAAAAGGVTSFMEMPNTRPPGTTQIELEKKYRIAAASSPVNYSFYMGATNDNLEEVLRTDPKKVCGVKVFMGSSTGNMLVDNRTVLEDLFAQCEMLIATHCEDEETIRANEKRFADEYGLENLGPHHHPLIRSREGCLLSSSLAVELAKKHGTRLHILHISTAEETFLFDKKSDNPNKHITAEACVHHLYFCDEDYSELGNKIKCNPAIKSSKDREAVLNAVLEDRIDVIATDHAPHTTEEKNQPYHLSPSGLPLVQHGINIMNELHLQGKISQEEVVRKMCHAPADLFGILDRGYLEEGMWADMFLFDPEKKWTVSPDNIFYKCKWSPLEGHTFRGKVNRTFVNGKTVYHNGKLTGLAAGERLEFRGV